MSKKIFELVRKTDLNDGGLQLILQCAPMLSGLKLSNLFKISKAIFKKLLPFLKNAGISYYVLSSTSTRYTLLLYYKERLISYLLRKEVACFLKSCGYPKEFSLTEVLLFFRKRYLEYAISKECFPHEMGLILGYPIEDVAGFIENSGKKYLLSGYWKVYSNPVKMESLFRSFDKAKDEMLGKYFAGWDISKIICSYQITSA